MILNSMAGKHKHIRRLWGFEDINHFYRNEPWFCDALPLVLLCAWRVRIDGNHLFIHVLPELLLLLRLCELLFQVGSHADLTVHHGRQSERGEAVLQLNEFCKKKSGLTIIRSQLNVVIAAIIMSASFLSG